MEQTNISRKKAAWNRYVEARERDQQPLPAYMNVGSGAHKTRTLFVRMQPRLMEQYEAACAERGLNPSEATRQLIAAWLRSPDSLPVGIPTQRQ